ncbi:uncharacterized protein N7483_005984 [Penicillium malachiteum]|uniref:uncharacterized protein n=1 Tax=Penicillium malachiteum TaxID=1324776 RepID=UPI0025493BC2|nr:uncharacterized protein N7483_005984 [Penicillium malachiteum]KAJ5731476.1 hypothetical protein N7483_005984 [Penicillium malachiteum]
MGLSRCPEVSPHPPNRTAQFPSEDGKGVNWYEHPLVDKAINGDPKYHELVPQEVKIIRNIALYVEKHISMHDPDMTRNRTWLVCLHWRFLGTRKTDEAWEWSAEKIWAERKKLQGNRSGKQNPG